MEWNTAHEVLKHLKNIELPRAEEAFELAKKEQTEAKENRMNDQIKSEILERKIHFKMKIERIRNAIVAIGGLQLGDIN